MIDFTTEEKQGGIPVAQPGVKLYAIAYVEQLIEKATQFDLLQTTTPAPLNGEGLKLYDPAYVKALEDQVVLLKMQNGIAAQLQPELEKLHAALPSTATTRKQVFMNEVMAADLEKLLNDGYEKWHAEFKGSKLYVVLVRDIPAEPTLDPVGARHTSPEAEPSKPAARVPDLIVEPGKVADIVDDILNPRPAPLEKEVLGEPVMSVAERWKADSNARILAAAQEATLSLYIARPAPAPFAQHLLEVSHGS